MITIDLVLLIVALVCFVAAALNVGSASARFDPTNLIAAGLAAWIASLVI